MLKITLTKEWIFLLLLGSVCTVLLVLQFRWAGELAIAERGRIDIANRKSAENLCQAFDLELQAACERALADQSTTTHAAPDRFATAALAATRPIFKRIGIVKFENGRHNLRIWDLDGGEVPLSESPDAWKRLAARFTAPARPPPPGAHLPDDFILEFPPAGFPMAADGTEWAGTTGWILLELDVSHLTKTWLPKLIEHYLGPISERSPDLLVTTRSDEMIYRQVRNGGKDARISIKFNRRGRLFMWKEGPPSEPIWRLDAAWPLGPVERMEAESRSRNFALAGSATGLVLLAGLMLARQTFRLRRMAEERIRFVSNVSHELRTPLTVISGAAFNLKRGIIQNGDETRKYASLILEHSEQLGSLVKDVLDFSRSKSSPSCSRRDVDVHEVLNSAIGDMDTTIPQMDLQISASGEPMCVNGDPVAIRSLFRNLLDNASRHGGSGGWIGISIDFIPHYVKIEFRDQGPGIPKRDQKKVFDPFYRGGNSDQVRGNGLGLSLARDIARAHGGDIIARSGQKGACFVVTLATQPKDDK